MGVKVEDISDKEILNWVVKPLKRSLKLGSNKEGYFIILDENDLHESYMSHYNNYLGYKATLDRHKDIAKYKNFPLEGFDFHL